MMIEPGVSLAGDRYEVRSRIGTGGMASVWLGHDTRLDRPVAIKIPADQIATDPRFSSRFEREARIAAGLSHPNLVPIYDYGVESDRAYLVMEHVAGESLAERVERGGKIEPRSLAIALLGALAHMHAAGVVHRDIKPDNILIKPSGRILVTDFGIAQIADSTQLTGTGLVLGTLRYIAPEIMAGERADPRSDLYSCGVVLGDCLADNDAADLRALADSLSAKDPDDRPSGAANALTWISTGGHGDAVRPGGLAEPQTTATTPISVDPASTAPIDPPTDEWSPLPAVAPSPTPRPVASAPVPLGRRPVPPRVVAVGVLGLLVAAVIAAFALSGEGDENEADGGARPDRANTDERRSNGEEAAPPPEDTAETPEQAEASPALDPAAAAALNDEGFALLEAGDPAAAVPILAESVASFPPESMDGSDINYVFALFNYGSALRQSGDPEAAIPILEERLQFDNQTEAVQAELDLARAEAGEESSDDEDD